MARALIWIALLGCSSRQSWVPGQTVHLRGRISDAPQAHLTKNIPGKIGDYFDHGDRQTFVYWVSAPACPGEIEVSGVVVEATSTHKRPTNGPRPARTYRELQLDVISTRCVP